jgi:gamma-glutamyltranspeptidase/glutathione hydrolase
MVCSNSPLAASAGIKTLQDGGNAFDAALAVAATETVTIIPSCGMGGDSFIVVYEAATGQVTGINSSGAAAAGATLDYYHGKGFSEMPLEGPHAVSVPGEVAAWELFHQRFCTRPFGQLLDTAIGYAHEGFPLAPGIGRGFKGSLNKLAQFPSTTSVYFHDGRPPAEGDMLANRDLARSLNRVIEGGADEFYQGGLAREMVQGLNDAGGVFSLDDFAGHQAEIYDPITTTYRDHTVYQTRPPSQGLITLEMLNLIEGFDVAPMGHNSADAIHLMVEAKKIAYDDRNRLAGDPKFIEWPLHELISKGYADGKRGEIDLSRASAIERQLLPMDGDGDTTYFCVADGAGNCVSWIHSLSNGFGSGFVAPGTGVLFNNRAGRGFSLRPGHPNAIAPGKRTMHTLNCYLTTRNGLPAIVGGTPGGDYQPQCGVQILTNLIDFGINPQQAVEAPRWWSFPGTDPATIGTPIELRVEPGMPEEAIAGLEARGHKVARRRPGVYDGKVQLIVLDQERGVLMGASDPRGDGQAAAW